MTTPEGKVKAKVSKLLASYGDEIYRFMPVQTGFGAVTLDYLGCFRGKFFAVETKAPGKKLTPLQQQTAQRIRAAGGQVFEVSDDQTLNLLKVFLESVCGNEPTSSD